MQDNTKKFIDKKVVELIAYKEKLGVNDLAYKLTLDSIKSGSLSQFLIVLSSTPIFFANVFWCIDGFLDINSIAINLLGSYFLIFITLIYVFLMF